MNGEIAILEAVGNLNAETCNEFQNQVLAMVMENERVIVNCEKLSYVSSAGLRVFLIAQKRAKELKHKLIFQAINVDVYDVLEMTGFTEILSIE